MWRQGCSFQCVTRWTETSGTNDTNTSTVSASGFWKIRALNNERKVNRDEFWGNNSFLVWRMEDAQWVLKAIPLFSVPVFPPEDPSSGIFLRQLGSWGKQPWPKESTWWDWAVDLLCGQGQNLTWRSEVQRTARQQKCGKSWRWEILDSCPPSLWVPLAAMCFRCSWARLILVTPACLWTMKNFLGWASKELFKAKRVCECHKPRAEGTDWAVTFAVLGCVSVAQMWNLTHKRDWIKI